MITGQIAMGTPKKGVYTFVLKLRQLNVKTGSLLPERRLPAGYYAYTGSAMGDGAQSLKRRVQRRLRRRKRLKWHIDYLLKKKESSVEWILLLPSEEQGGMLDLL